MTSEPTWVETDYPGVKLSSDMELSVGFVIEESHTDANGVVHVTKCRVDK
jgi:hypothetical protein